MGTCIERIKCPLGVFCVVGLQSEKTQIGFLSRDFIGSFVSVLLFLAELFLLTFLTFMSFFSSSFFSMNLKYSHQVG
jgi:hypothetical protein